MSRTWKRRILLALAIVVPAAVVVLLLQSRSSDPRAKTQETSPARPAQGGDARSQGQRGDRSAPLDPSIPAGHGDGTVADAGNHHADDGGDEPRFRLAKLFEGDCQFGVNAHCREWAERAARCDEGNSQACVELGDLLIGESPMQPLWGSLVLQRACELGQDDVCERADRWNEWSRYGYSPKGVDATLPEGLAARCDEGDLVSCGLIEMRRGRSEGGLDEETALAACRAGFRDVCAVLLEVADGPRDVIAALRAGCELPDAWMCFYLGQFYATSCSDGSWPVACPPHDPERASRYVELACRLEPEIHPCRDPG